MEKCAFYRRVHTVIFLVQIHAERTFPLLSQEPENLGNCSEIVPAEPTGLHSPLFYLSFCSFLDFLLRLFSLYLFLCLFFICFTLLSLYPFRFSSLSNTSPSISLSLSLQLTAHVLSYSNSLSSVLHPTFSLCCFFSFAQSYISHFLFLCVFNVSPPGNVRS